MAIIGALPYTISDGQAIDAVPVMANFTWILNQVNANAVGAAPGAAGNILYSNGTIWTSVSLSSLLTSYAPLASPAFSGSPTVPNQPLGTSNAVIANAQFATQIGIGTFQTDWTLYSRSAGTVYTNYANGPLCVCAGVSFFAAGDTARFQVNGHNVCEYGATGATAAQQVLWTIVPVSGSYQLILAGSAALTASTWREF